MTVLTKSGTNEIHGSAFEFFRDRNFNATEHNTAPSTGKTPYNQHRFGFTAGGPIKHDRTFVFGSYAGFRFVSANRLSTPVPSAAMQAGNFSENLPTTVLTGAAAFASTVTTSSAILLLAQPIPATSFPHLLLIRAF